MGLQWDSATRLFTLVLSLFWRIVRFCLKYTGKHCLLRDKTNRNKGLPKAEYFIIWFRIHWHHGEKMYASSENRIHVQKCFSISVRVSKYSEKSWGYKCCDTPLSLLTKWLSLHTVLYLVYYSTYRCLLFNVQKKRRRVFVLNCHYIFLGWTNITKFCNLQEQKKNKGVIFFLLSALLTCENINILRGPGPCGKACWCTFSTLI